jgi:hypothetical protein
VEYFGVFENLVVDFGFGFGGVVALVKLQKEGDNLVSQRFVTLIFDICEISLS